MNTVKVQNSKKSTSSDNTSSNDSSSNSSSDNNDDPNDDPNISILSSGPVLTSGGDLFSNNPMNADAKNNMRVLTPNDDDDSLARQVLLLLQLLQLLLLILLILLQGDSSRDSLLR